MPALEQTILNRLTEDAFFQGNCLLEDDFMSAVLNPSPGLLQVLMAMQSNTPYNDYGMLGDYAADATGTQPDYICSPATQINPASNFINIRANKGRHQILSGTFEEGEIKRDICNPDKFYDKFYIISDQAGISRSWTSGLQNESYNTLFQWAILRQMADIANRVELWLQHILWQGNPTNNTANNGYMEFDGIERLNTNTYNSDATLPATSQSGLIADLAPLNNVTIDFASAKVGGGVSSIYATFQDLERTVYHRAMMSGMLPATWVFVMSPNMWYELVKVWPCEMAGDGCSVGTVQSNDGGSGLFNMQLREQLLSSGTIRVNGREYSVIVDHNITEEVNQPTAGDYRSDIHMIPLTVRGIPATFIPYFDFSIYNERFRPVPEQQRKGYTDNGKFLHRVVYDDSWCFQILSRTEPGLAFRAPQLAGRITNAVVCPSSPLPAPSVSYTASV